MSTPIALVGPQPLTEGIIPAALLGFTLGSAAKLPVQKLAENLQRARARTEVEAQVRVDAGLTTPQVILFGSRDLISAVLFTEPQLAQAVRTPADPLQHAFARNPADLPVPFELPVLRHPLCEVLRLPGLRHEAVRRGVKAVRCLCGNCEEGACSRHSNTSVSRRAPSGARSRAPQEQCGPDRTAPAMELAESPAVTVAQRGDSMPWARLDDSMPMHPKIRATSDAAFRLYISALCWSNMHLSNGKIGRDYLRFISDVRSAPRCAAELVRLGLWEELDDGWQIHGYLEYQLSADKILHERKLAAVRRAKWKAARGNGIADAAGDAAGDGALDAVADAAGDAGRDAATSHTHVSTSSVGAETEDRTRARDMTSLDWRRQRAFGPRRSPPPDSLTEATRQAITARTGAVVSEAHAHAVAACILGNEIVRNPVAYVTAAVEREPKPERFLPTAIPPPVDAGPRRPDQEQINTRGAARARKAINPPKGNPA